ncbi:MAG: biotin/lipoyl-binding protein, partial [Thiohalocapsa sp.]
MKRSVYLSMGLLGAVTAWMLSGSLVGASRTDVPAALPTSAAQPQTQSEIQPMRVRVEELQAEPVANEVLVQGHLEPRRRVEIRAQTGGLVTALPVDKGARVSAGDVLIELALDDREAQLARAEAEVESRRLELSASEKLGSKGMQARTQV